MLDKLVHGGVFKYAKISASVEKREICNMKSWLVTLRYMNIAQVHWCLRIALCILHKVLLNVYVSHWTDSFSCEVFAVHDISKQLCYYFLQIKAKY